MSVVFVPAARASKLRAAEKLGPVGLQVTSEKLVKVFSEDVAAEKAHCPL